MQNISTFLWFQSDSAAAAELYCSIFPTAKITSRSAQSTSFELDGQRYILFEGGPHYALTPATSIMVQVETQAEIDALWSKFLTTGGKESRCGWLVDRFGLSWQIVPRHLPELLAKPRAVEAMMKMQKLDIATLEAAARE